MKNKKGFTLAEVLITLAIIGVIAAITIPSIVANHQKTALETQFAKTYRTLSQAINLAVAEHGGMESWDWKDSYTDDEKKAFMETYFLPYLNVAKFCPEASIKGCAFSGITKKKDGTNWMTLDESTNPRVLLADGTHMQFYIRNNAVTTAGAAISLYMDINGAKAPNTIGKDTFNFQFYAKTGEFVPSGMVSGYDENVKKYVRRSYEEIKEDCKNSDSGNSCTALVVADGFKINY